MEAIGHASAAGEHDYVADLLVEHHLALIRSGAGRTLLLWARTLPDDVLAAHPEVVVASAITTVIMGAGAMERRRYLGLINRAHTDRQSAPNAYVESAALICRALAIEGGVGPAVTDGRRAVEVTEADHPELADGALAAYARALYFAGDLEQARATALCALEHPEVTRRVPTLIHVHTTLALAAVAEDRPGSGSRSCPAGTEARRTARRESELARRERLRSDGRPARGGRGARGGRARARHGRARLPRRRADRGSHMAAAAACPGARPSRTPRSSGGGSSLRARGARRDPGSRHSPLPRRGDRARDRAGNHAREHRRPSSKNRAPPSWP